MDITRMVLIKKVLGDGYEFHYSLKKMGDRYELRYLSEK